MKSDDEIEIVDFDKLDVYLLSGNRRDNPKNLHSVYAKSFACWYDTWNDYFHGEYQTNVKLASTEFTRQDDILALFYKGECFGVTFFKEVDWDDPTASLDAYFQPWTPEAIEGLTSKGNKVIICSQFTIAKSFRSIKTDISWKHILCGFTMTRFLNSDAHAMTGTMRISKGMHKVAAYGGAVTLVPNLKCDDHEGEFVELMAFFQDNVETTYANNPYHEKWDGCWSRLNGRLHSQLRLVA